VVMENDKTTSMQTLIVITKNKCDACLT